MENTLTLVTKLARTYQTDAVSGDIITLIDSGVDWDEVLGLMQYHRVSALCLQALKKLNQPAVPARLLKELQSECTEHTRNALVLMSELQRLMALSRQHGIDVVSFKGIVAAQLIYGQLSMRNFSDIDLYTRGSDHARCEQMLLENGYRLTQRYDDAFQSGLRNDSRWVNVDLHWGIPPRELHLASDLLWDDVTTITIGGVSIPTFSLNDSVLLTAVNAVKAYWESRLYRFCDLAELLRRHPQLDWSAVFRRARQLGCRRILEAALLVTQQLLDAPVPRDIAKQIGRRQGSSMVVEELLAQLAEENDDSDEAGYRQTLRIASAKHYFLALQDSAWHRWCYWWRWATTPGAADRELVKLPSALASLYYFIRPIRLLFKPHDS